MRIDELEKKKVAIWGFGREGRSTLRTLRRRLPELPLTVLNDSPLAPGDAAPLAADRLVSVRTGSEALAALPSFDVVVKSPGISRYRPEVTAALAQGVVFTSATALWFSECPQAKTLCITGTKGKSTTASLAAHLLVHAGRSVELAGNIGRPLLDALETPPSSTLWVIELSSYQICDLRVSPSVAVLLNLFPEHLDWHGDRDTYYRDKLNLFGHLESGVAVLNQTDEVTGRFLTRFKNPVFFNDPLGIHSRDGWIRRGEERLLPVERIALPGAQNVSNVCAALTALQCVGVDVAGCCEALASFRPLPHRLTPVGEKGGVLYVDDSLSTIPQATQAAVEAYPHRAVTVLVGGLDRGIEVDDLARFLVERPVHAVITMSQSGPRIAASVRRALHSRPPASPASAGAREPLLYETGSLAQAVGQARRVTPKGGVVLLSPAAPSYAEFVNFEQRGKAFARAAGLAPA